MVHCITEYHENDIQHGMLTQHVLRIQRLSSDAVLPTLGTPGAIGYDLASAASCTVPAHGRTLVPTMLAIQVPHGTYGRIAPRSGLALKHSIDVSAGVVDPDYCGAVGVVLVNHGPNDFAVRKGDRIAQLILEAAIVVPVVEVVSICATARGIKGFGSTGVSCIPC